MADDIHEDGMRIVYSREFENALKNSKRKTSRSLTGLSIK